jgi:uncharacterized protein YgiM (DUF1202 family)
MVILTQELFLNGEMILSRKETHGKSKQSKSEPVFTSRIEKHEYYKSISYFDIRNVLDIKGALKQIRANWNTYVSQVHQWIQKNAVKKLVVTGIFTVVFGLFASTSNAGFIKEYTYQVKSGENIENIAAEHGVTAQEILIANGLSSIDGKKILLPKVEDRTVTATVLNVRSEPNTKSSVIGTYKKGDVVKVSFVENGWAGILIKGRLCFVSADYLVLKQATEPAPSQTAETMYVNATSLNVRAAASTSSSIIGSLKLNDPVVVTSSINGWAQITFKGKTAFVSEKYITKNESTNKINDTLINTNSYAIKSGDTFKKIGKTFGISVSSIQELNPGVDSSKLKIGQIIKIPPASNSVSAENQILVTAQLSGVDPQGTFRFITSNGATYTAKASGDMINELFNHQGENITLTLEGNRGNVMTLVSLQ